MILRVFIPYVLPSPAFQWADMQAPPIIVAVRYPENTICGISLLSSLSTPSWSVRQESEARASQSLDLAAYSSTQSRPTRLRCKSFNMVPDSLLAATDARPDVDNQKEPFKFYLNFFGNLIGKQSTLRQIQRMTEIQDARRVALCTCLARHAAQLETTSTRGLSARSD